MGIFFVVPIFILIVRMEQAERDGSYFDDYGVFHDLSDD